MSRCLQKPERSRAGSSTAGWTMFRRMFVTKRCARDEAVDIALRALAPFFGPPAARILGRVERLDPLHASLMNGISSHVYDYDDTTPKHYSHPSSPVATALFAYASVKRVAGPDFVHAFILGFEAESRVANAVYPAHYDIGWHIAGTAGVFGAATATG